MSVLWGCKVGHCIKPLLSDDARDPLNKPITILLSPLLFKTFFFWATPYWPMPNPFSSERGVTIPVRSLFVLWFWLAVLCCGCDYSWFCCVCFAFEQQTFLIWERSDDTCAFLVRVVVVRCEAWCLLLSARRRHACPQVWAQHIPSSSCPPLWPALWPVTIFPDLSHLLISLFWGLWFKCALKQASYHSLKLWLRPYPLSSASSLDQLNGIRLLNFWC